MGRHSAGGDEDEPARADVALDEDAAPHGRHARPEDAEQTGPPALLEDEHPTEPAPVVDAAGPVSAKKTRASGTASDLALLRSRPDLRARCIAAVIVPFVLYVGAMLIVGAERVQYLLWLWIPLILGLVLAGNFLDMAHKRAAAERAADEVDDEADRPA